jgi:excinuclease ABC subunit A
MAKEEIVIKGAREHNLRNIDLKVPKRKLIVFTGVSGSGKSSLAFDTLYAEGQRRYVESLSSYARQFLGQMEKPRYDRIGGLSPTIAIEQKQASNNPRSTVGTITEIHDYLRVLYARIGHQHCHLCGRPVGRRSAEEIVTSLLRLPEKSKLILLAPLVDNRKGEHRELIENARRDGFIRFRVDGATINTDEQTIELDKKKKHNIDLIVDRLVIGADVRARLTDSVELALRKGGGKLIVTLPDGKDKLYSEQFACAYCGVSFLELAPALFSFNSPLGMCEECNGLGTRAEMDPELVVPDTSLSVREGAIEPWARVMDKNDSWEGQLIESVARHYKINLDKPYKKLTAREKQLLLYGTKSKVNVEWQREGRGSGNFNMRFEGVLNQLMRRFRQTQSEGMRKYYLRYFSEQPCSSCNGERLRAESRAVYINGKSIVGLAGLSIFEAKKFIDNLELDGNEKIIATELVKEIISRLTFLNNVGLSYLSLDRMGSTLSGGESQRIRLASQIGSELTGVLYILDEPSIGLHQRDNGRLLDTLRHLRDLGNTVLVVEHDQETIESADHVVDFGPGAGLLGGEVVFSGTPKGLARSSKSLTGAYLSGREEIALPKSRRNQNLGQLTVVGASENNLKNIDVDFPFGRFTAVTGVSGAGKSSLTNGILRPALMHHIYTSFDRIGTHRKIKGLKDIDKVVSITQEPIGRTPRSNPATYVKVFDHIRALFAMTQEAKTYGYQPGRFSFNVTGGRCSACSGDGMIKIEMHFLPDVYVPCQVCHGKRFNEATLRVRYKGYNISDVLGLSVNQALEVFKNHKKIARILQTLADVGLGYIKLGQPSPTLSGGEAQRIKLSRELAKISTGRTVYLLDEPTTGLHFEDIKKLLAVLNRLVDSGNTVIVIEHNLDVIKSADWVIDLGPEGGDQGGEVVAVGTPEQVAKIKKSYTGQHLRNHLESAAKRKK